MSEGAGDLATGTIYCLHQCGFQVAALEIENPTVIRGMPLLQKLCLPVRPKWNTSLPKKAETKEQIEACWRQGQIPIMADAKGVWIERLKPAVVVDAILAKRIWVHSRAMAPLVIGLGPGFTAGDDVDVVIETMRGHQLGRMITEGTAIANTGVPGNIGGFTSERVIHAPASGMMEKCMPDQ